MFRRTKGAVKLHLLLDHDGFLPCYAVITEGRGMRSRWPDTALRAWTILVIDRGYVDYDWFAELSQQGVFFVTRMKDNAVYAVLQERELPRRKGLLRDEMISFYQQARTARCYFLRIEVYDQEQDRVLVFLTNHLTLAPRRSRSLPAALADRAVLQSAQAKPASQNLRGDSANALQIQIWTALIALLVLKYLQLRPPSAGLCPISWRCCASSCPSIATCGCGFHPFQAPELPEALPEQLRNNIYWSPATGAWDIYGAIYAGWSSNGGPLGPLGLPISGETDTPSLPNLPFLGNLPKGRFHDFERGVIVWYPSGPYANAHTVQGVQLHVKRYDCNEKFNVQINIEATPANGAHALSP